jgi:hypothetical protein
MQVDAEIDSELPHRREPVALNKLTAHESVHHLIAYLRVERDVAGGLYGEKHETTSFAVVSMTANLRSGRAALDGIALAKTFVIYIL